MKSETKLGRKAFKNAKYIYSYGHLIVNCNSFKDTLNAFDVFNNKQKKVYETLLF